MSSRLGRLFAYSKQTAVFAHENFTTEALAACIELDPTPFASALLASANLDPTVLLSTELQAALRDLMAPGSSQVRVETQMYLPTIVGYLDLRLSIHAMDPSSVAEIWVEVKVDSPIGVRSPAVVSEGGSEPEVTQLDVYQREIEASGEGTSRCLVLLAKTGPPPTSSALWLPWNVLYAAIHRDLPASREWRDLAAFLEETKVADESELAISPREAGALSDAVSLFRKVSRVLLDVDSYLESKGYAAWRGAVKVQMGLAYYLRTSGRFVIGSGSTPGGVEYGLIDDRNGDPEWVFLVRSMSGERFADQLRTAGNSGDAPLSNEWERIPGSEVVFRRTVRFVDCHERADVTGWLIDRILEVERAGVLPLLKPKGPSPAPVALEPVEPQN